MKTIFIVEDDEDLQTSIKCLLEIMGFKVVGIASNGEQAILIFKDFKKKPDIILMDYRMPLKNGLEVSKEILQIDPRMKIILTSADTSVKEEALSSGISDFLEKPFLNQTLINSINRISE